MVIKKLNLDESLFNDNWTPTIDDVVAPIDDTYDDEFVDYEGTPSAETAVTSLPKTVEENGVASIIIDMVKDELDTIDNYNSCVATMRELGGYDEFVVVLADIIAEENRHVGQLQSILKQISPNAAEIDRGEAEANHQFNMVDGKLQVQAWSTEGSANKLPNEINDACTIGDVDDDM